MNHETTPQESPEDDIETILSNQITIGEQTQSLRDWIKAFCPVPIEEMDFVKMGPDNLKAYAIALQEGRNPHDIGQTSE